MGKMNRLNTRKPNGDEGRDCEVEKWCGEPAYQLSSTDKNIGVALSGIQPYERLIRYKCANGHYFEKTFQMERDLLGAAKPNQGKL